MQWCECDITLREGVVVCSKTDGVPTIFEDYMMC